MQRSQRDELYRTYIHSTDRKQRPNRPEVLPVGQDMNWQMNLVKSFLISKFLQLKPKDQHFLSIAGFANHARQAKNDQPTSRSFPSSSLGKTHRKLPLRHAQGKSFLRPTQLPRILNHPQLARSFNYSWLSGS